MLNENKSVSFRYVGLSVLTAAFWGPGFADASETSIAFRYERSFKDNKYYQPEIELAHRFDNRLTVNVLQKRRLTESTDEDGYAIQQTSVGLAYALPLGANDRFTLTPKFEYLWKHRQEILRPSLKLYYKINDQWGTGIRYRYEYQAYNSLGKQESRVSRYDYYLDYNVTDKLKLSWDPSYHAVSGTAGGTFYTGENYRIEHWLTASYKVNNKNTVGVTYKWKEKNYEASKYNADDHDNLLMVAYIHKF